MGWQWRGISCIICKSFAPRCRWRIKIIIIITMPVAHQSVFYGPDALPAALPTASKHWMMISTEGGNISTSFSLKRFQQQSEARHVSVSWCVECCHISHVGDFKYPQRVRTKCWDKGWSQLRWSKYCAKALCWSVGLYGHIIEMYAI